jgi:hypothetical protein
MSKSIVIQIAGLTDHIADALDIVRDLAAGDARWLNALNAGASWLLEQEAVTFEHETHTLTVPSPSGKVYRSNGACGCDAYANNSACWHRGASRLLLRALELQQQAPELAAFCRGRGLRRPRAGS